MDDQTPDTPTRKPKGILILQVLTALLIAGMMFALCRALWNQVMSEQFGMLFSDAATRSWYLVRFVMVVANVVTFMIVQHRSQLSRWIAVAGVVAIMCWLVLVPPPPDFSSGGVSATVAFYLIILAPLFALAYFVGFSRKARAYFAGAPRGSAHS